NGVVRSFARFLGGGQPDADGDHAPDACDVCPDVPDPGQRDRDADGRGDACDDCPSVVNPEQDDVDQDGLGDVCDNCPFHANPDQLDQDVTELSHQSAVSASASSEYSPTEYSARQATGPRNTLQCGDLATAWAPRSDGDGEEWLEVGFGAPVTSIGLVIYETFTGGFVFQVDLIDEAGAIHMI